MEVNWLVERYRFHCDGEYKVFAEGLAMVAEIGHGILGQAA